MYNLICAAIFTGAFGLAVRVIWTMLRDYWPQMVEAMLIGTDPYCDRCGQWAEKPGYLCDACSDAIKNGADYETP